MTGTVKKTKNNNITGKQCTLVFFRGVRLQQTFSEPIKAFPRNAIAQNERTSTVNSHKVLAALFPPLGCESIKSAIVFILFP